VLKTGQPEGHYAFADNHRDDLHLLAQCVGDFVSNVIGGDGDAGEKDQEVSAIEERFFDGGIPVGAGFDVELIEPYIGAGRLQIPGEPEGELGV
jgi:hypothetical protein